MEPGWITDSGIERRPYESGWCAPSELSAYKAVVGGHLAEEEEGTAAGL